ncbi:MAG: MMPL family transporter [Planctomycetia bacterium]|nr:MMPL family transporter [Planctomycetia bacterium]
MEDWVPAGFEETKNLSEFQEIFGCDEIMFISWEGCTLDSPQLQEMKHRLLEPIRVRDGSSRILFQKILTGKDVYDILENEVGLERDEVLARLRGYLLSNDGQETALIALISEDGRIFRQEAVHSVSEIADSIPGLSAEKIKVGGSTTDSVSIDDISRLYIIEMNAVSYLIGIFISYLCFRNLRAALLVFFISFFNQQVCLALIYYMNIPFDSVLLLAANLTFVLSMSAGIHLVNYYREAIRSLPPQQAVYQALSTALVPTFISVVTTVAGLLSFVSSQLVPIGKFGWISSLALVISIFLLMIYVPLHFLVFPIYAWQGKDKKDGVKEADGDGLAESAAPTWLGKKIEGLFFPLVNRYSYGVVFLAVVLAAVGIYGALHIKTNIGIHSMLRSDTRPIQNYKWIEENFGPLVPVEIMLDFPAGENMEIFDRLRVVNDLVKQLEEKVPDTGVISILNFLQDIPEGRSSGDAAKRRAYAGKLSRNQDMLNQSGFFVEKDGRQYWRITLRTYAMKKNDYGPLLDNIHEIVHSVLAETEAGVQVKKGILAKSESEKEGVAVTEAAENVTASSPARFLVTGGVPLVFRAQEQLLTDLKISFMTAFFIIAFILMVLFRSVRCGIFAVFPSVLPCIIIFGLVGWLGVRVEIGTMLTGSAALGIAVDNAVHYITWFRIAHQRGLGRKDAVRMAFQKCGVAMFQTAAVCSFGLVSYVVSPFIPVIYFSYFMFALLMVALLSDLTVLPAILITRGGQAFLKNIPQDLQRGNPAQAVNSSADQNV